MGASRVNTWRTRCLGDLLTYEQPGRYLVRSTDYVPRGRYPVLTAGKTFVLGYTNEPDGAYTDHPVIIFDDFTTASKYVDFDFKAKSSAMKMLKARPGEADLRFMYERMQLIHYPIFDHKRHWIAELSKLEVEVPGPEEQAAVAEVADDLSTYIALLERMTAKKQAIKQGMMQQLLTGETRLPGFRGQWDQRRIGSLIDGLEAGVSVRSSAGATRGPAILKTSCVDTGRFRPTEAKPILGADVSRARCNPVGGGLIVSRMNTPALVGDVGYVAETRLDLFLPDRLWLARPKSGIATDMRWLAYYLASEPGARQLRGLATGTSGSMKNIPKVRALALDIDVPGEAEQRAISEVLQTVDDEIDALGQRLEKARAIKAGMMQELLTGRARLPPAEAAT
jgi:hypothetical protein